MHARRRSGLCPWKTIPPVVLFLMMTCAPGVHISVTAPANSVCAGRLWLTASGPHGAMLTAMRNPALNCT